MIVGEHVLEPQRAQLHVRDQVVPQGVQISVLLLAGIPVMILARTLVVVRQQTRLVLPVLLPALVAAQLHVLKPAQILVRLRHLHIAQIVQRVVRPLVLKPAQMHVKQLLHNIVRIARMIVLQDAQQIVRIIVRLDVKIVVLEIVQILVNQDVEDAAEIHVVVAAPICQQVVSALVVQHLVL